MKKTKDKIEKWKKDKHEFGEYILKNTNLLKIERCKARIELLDEIIKYLQKEYNSSEYVINQIEKIYEKEKKER